MENPSIKFVEIVSRFSKKVIYARVCEHVSCYYYTISTFYVPIYQSAKSYLSKDDAAEYSLRFHSDNTLEQCSHIVRRTYSIRKYIIRWYPCRATKIWFSKRLKKTNKTRSEKKHTHTIRNQLQQIIDKHTFVHIHSPTYPLALPPTLQLIICGEFHTFCSKSREKRIGGEEKNISSFLLRLFSTNVLLS